MNVDMRSGAAVLAVLLAGVLAALPLPAVAHDTWLTAVRADTSGRVRLVLSTGAHFPLAESAIAAEHLANKGCRELEPGAPAMSLQPLARGDAGLLLQAAPAPPPGSRPAGLTCWVQSTVFDVSLTPELVETYFREIRPPPEVLAAWQQQRQRGIAWRERYVKHARIVLPGPEPARPQEAAPLAPADDRLGLDVVLESGPAPLVGDTLRFRVLRDGRPLAGQSIELRSELVPIGIWRRTDDEGRADVVVPLAGRWVLRGTELRIPASEGEPWQSRFVTLAFTAAPRRP